MMQAITESAGCLNAGSSKVKLRRSSTAGENMQSPEAAEAAPGGYSRDGSTTV
eukprot:COSAG04_NODE_31930_length_254_cov_0.658065_1_plen_52_part_01